MSIKKLVIGGIAAGIIFFLLGWLIYGILLMDYMTAHPGITAGYNRTAPDMLYLAIGNLLLGFLLAFIFVKANIATLSNGLITGAVAGVLIVAGFNCMSYGLTTLVSKKMMLADVGGAVLVWAVTGALLGLILGKVK